jgi:hypothetical protein
MKRHLFFLTTLLLIALAGCAPGGTAVYQPQVNCYIPPGSAPEAVATLTTRCQQDAQATIAAQAQATRQVQEGTAQANQEATAQAVAIAGSTAVAAAATSENLTFRATEMAMQFEVANATGTAQANQMWLSATGTAVAVQAAALATAEAQRAENVAMVQRDTQRMLENKRAREAFWNAAYPWIVTVVLLVLVAGTGFWLFLQWRNRQPVMQVVFENGNGMRQSIPIIRDAQGGYRHLPGTLPHQGGRLALGPGDEVQAETAVHPVPLPQLNQHVMIVGQTGEGKSMALREVVDQRDDVIVLDPHYLPGAWGAARVLYEPEKIQSFMAWMLQELDTRMQQRNGGQTAFPSLTVATEELPMLVDQIGSEILPTWKRWMREGRKFGLNMVIVTQSTRVKSLGIEGEGDLLESFNWILELESSALTNYRELVEGMERPAVLRNRKNPPQPVIIPYDPRKDPDNPSFTPFFVGGNSPSSRVVEPPRINLPPRVSQAEQDGRKLDGRIEEISSLNAAGLLLSDDVTERPSGQFLQERLRPALEWRARQLGCEHARRLLMRYQS